MRTLREKYYGHLPVDESNFKADFNILEKYQAFSSEILRLALLGLAIFGFLITNIVFKTTETGVSVFLKPFNENKTLFIAGALLLLASAAFALAHRYFSTDCMSHFIRGLRLDNKLSQLNALEEKSEDIAFEISEIDEKIINENISFEKDLDKCRWSLLFCCLFLLLGVGLVLTGLVETLSANVPVAK